jgi:predicted PurR-regulated permease PerM
MSTTRSVDQHPPTHGAPAKRPQRTKPIVIAPRTLATFVAFSLAGVALVAFLYTVRVILGELLAAAILAVALEPLVQWMERRGRKRATAVSLTFLAFVMVTVLFVIALVPPLSQGLPRLVREVPVFFESFMKSSPVAALEERYQILDSVRTWWTENGGARLIGEPTLRFAMGFLGTGSALATVIFFSFLVLLSGPGWFAGFLQLVPSESRDLWRRMGDGITKAVGGYVLGNLLLSVIAGTVATIVLLIARVPYAIPLGLIVAIFDLIPMVGASLATVLVAVVALSQGIGTCAIVVGALTAYQLVENNILTQAVYHGTVKLSLLTITVSLAIGAQLGGMAGAVMAIPVAAALKVAVDEAVAWNRR